MENTASAAKTKKTLKRCLIIALVLVLLTATVFIFKWIDTRGRENKAIAYLNNKTFVLDDGANSIWGRIIWILNFEDGRIFVEKLTSDPKSAEKSVAQYDDCTIKASMFDENIALQNNPYNTLLLLTLRDDGTVVNHTYHDTDPMWKETTNEEVAQLRAVFLCDSHKFSQWTVILSPGCTTEGKQQHTCEKCGYLESESIESLGHNYQNKVCTICGAKKQPQKADDIEANTWYTYQDVLHVQNIKLHNAFPVSQGKGMSVSYYFVCQYCHVVDECLQISAPEFNYKINKIFTCEECGGLTTVKMELG